MGRASSGTAASNDSRPQPANTTSDRSLGATCLDHNAYGYAATSPYMHGTFGVPGASAQRFPSSATMFEKNLQPFEYGHSRSASTRNPARATASTISATDHSHSWHGSGFTNGADDAM